MENESFRNTPRSMLTAAYVLMLAVFVFSAVERHRRPVLAAPGDAAQSALSRQIETRIDPNIAPWSELARLPDIGEGLARQIVKYREAVQTKSPSVVAFKSVEDLDPVPGLGPKRLERMSPFLKFPPAPLRSEQAS